MTRQNESYSTHYYLTLQQEFLLNQHVRPLKGKGNASAVGTLVELKSGYLILARRNDATATATAAVEGSSAALNRMPLAARKSMTYDQGR